MEDTQERHQVAVLFTRHDSIYKTLNVDCWSRARNALNYKGPNPVIAHPPCARWGSFATKGDRLIGDDSNTFAHAIWCVRTFGGVIEHPANSKAWRWFGIKQPHMVGWTHGDQWGSVCCIEQGNYGHKARKPTWLYSTLGTPELDWGPSVDKKVPLGSLNKHDREATPVHLANTLIHMVLHA
jgi:hypothetical protein